MATVLCRLPEQTCTYQHHRSDQTSVYWYLRIDSVPRQIESYLVWYSIERLIWSYKNQQLRFYVDCQSLHVSIHAVALIQMSVIGCINFKLGAMIDPSLTNLYSSYLMERLI
jgi:hypothetical protein